MSASSSPPTLRYTTQYVGRAGASAIRIGMLFMKNGHHRLGGSCCNPGDFEADAHPVIPSGAGSALKSSPTATCNAKLKGLPK